jgi:hypothetical protein
MNSNRKHNSECEVGKLINRRVQTDRTKSDENVQTVNTNAKRVETESSDKN